MPEQLQRAMAAEAEAVREARAKVIAAEGEHKASRALRQAAEVIIDSPAALQVNITHDNNMQGTDISSSAAEISADTEQHLCIEQQHHSVPCPHRHHVTAHEHRHCHGVQAEQQHQHDGQHDEDWQC